MTKWEMQGTNKSQGKAEELEEEQQITASSPAGGRVWKGATRVKSPRARDRQDSLFLHTGCPPWEGTDWV